MIVKETEPLRLAEMCGVTARLAPEYIGPVFLALSPRLTDHLRRAGARPGTLVHYFERPGDEASVLVHVGYELGDQTVPEGAGVEIVELPVVRVASVVHRGGMQGIVALYEALFSWIETRGYRRSGQTRELYHEMDDGVPRVTELQVPITS